MKHRAIMPNIKCLRRLPRRNIRDYPLYVGTSRAKSSLRCGKRRFRNIEDGDDFKTLIKKRIDPGTMQCTWGW